jgi:hypothetical protein
MWSDKCVPTYQKESDEFIMRVDEPSLMNEVGSSGSLGTSIRLHGITSQMTPS